MITDSLRFASLKRGAAVLAVGTLLSLTPAEARRRRPKPTPTPTAAPVVGSAPASPAVVSAKDQGILFPYDLLDKALQNRVNESGEVDYPALKGNKYLDVFVQDVAAADLTKFPVFPQKDKDGKTIQTHAAELVFWINASNALVLKTVADAYPIDSPSQIKDFNTARTHVVAGKAYTFPEIMARIGKMDVRALFCLTDGSHNGPMLADQAYRFYNIDDRLNAAASVFVNDARNVSIDRIHNVVTVSPYFAMVDTLYTAPGARKKWDGIRYLLHAYTKSRANKDYLGGGDYKVEFSVPDYGLNIKPLR